MRCRECPYINAEYNKKINYVQSNNHSGCENEIEKSCWCEKVGGKLWTCECCNEAYKIVNAPNKCSKRKHRNKIERDKKYKNHLKFISEHIPIYPGVRCINEVYVDGKGYVPLSKSYYKRYYRGKHGKSKKLKRFSNRKVRRYKREIHNGGVYKKVFDYWQTLY